MYEWYIFASCCVPLLIEVLVGGQLETPITWNVVVLVGVCTMFRHDLDMKIASLTALVIYSWMSFFQHLQPGVACMIPSEVEDWLQECRKGGLARNCLSSIETLNRLKKQQDDCPMTVLGSALGTAYYVLVYAFRVIPCCVLAPLQLRGLQQQQRRQQQQQQQQEHSTVFALSVAIAVCCIMEIAVVDVKRLSSLEVILPFVFALQIRSPYLRSKLFNLGMFYSISDFFMNSTSTIYKCVGAGVSQRKLLDMCRSGNEQSCMEGIHLLGSLEAEDCPRGNFASVVMCLSAVMKVSLLTVGVMFTPGVEEEFPSEPRDDSLGVAQKAGTSSSCSSSSNLPTSS